MIQILHPGGLGPPQETSPQKARDYLVMAAVGEESQLDPLLKIACALAETRQGTVLLLAVSPDGRRPDWLVIPENSCPVPVEVKVVVGRHERDIEQATMKAGREASPDLLLVPWQDPPDQGRYRLGPSLDRIMQNVPCDVAVVQGRKPKGIRRVLDDVAAVLDDVAMVRDRKPKEIRRVLVPVAGGPNATLALEIALALSEQVQVTALYVARQAHGQAGISLGREHLEAALKPWAGEERLSLKVRPAPAIIEGILAEASSDYDLVLIGASQEGFLDRVLFGNVPRTVTTRAPVPVVVVRRGAGLVGMVLHRVGRWVYEALPTLSMAEQVETYKIIRRGARPDVDFFVMMALAAAIATLGLVLNNPAVIIGAMLVAPLMSAVLGIGLGIVQGDLRLLRVAGEAVVRGIILAVAVGLLMAWIMPGASPNAEILGRTSPSLLDLAVALASGAAGAYALCRKDVSASLPGVAIAAALVPPLTTIGIGLALGRGWIAGGASLLFLTNLVAISTAGGLIFFWLGFRPGSGEQKRRLVFQRGAVWLLALLAVLSALLGILTVNSLRQAAFERAVQEVLAAEITAREGWELADWQIASREDDTLHLEIHIRASRQVLYQEMAHLQARLAERLQQPVALLFTVMPTTRLEPLALPPRELEATATPVETRINE